MPCDADISAVVDEIEALDNSIKQQVYKKIEKVKENPECGERKQGTLSNPDLRVIKAFKQRVVLFYKIVRNSPCEVIFIRIVVGHDQAYRNTF